MAGISLNGVTFYPSDVPEELELIGESIVSDNGTRRWIQIVDGSSNPIRKRSWTIPWNDVPAATRAAIKAIALLGTTFTFVNELGESYTVQCEEKCFSSNVSTISGDNLNYYTVSLTIFEA
jgi:hypothetical protein